MDTGTTGWTRGRRKYRHLVSTFRQARFEQVIMSGTLPVMRSRGKGY